MLNANHVLIERAIFHGIKVRAEGRAKNRNGRISDLGIIFLWVEIWKDLRGYISVSWHMTRLCVLIVLNIPSIEKVKYFRFAAVFGSLIPK